MNYNVSICVLTYNSEFTLKKLLDQITKIECEIIIVDSGSTDKTLNIMNEAAQTNNIKIHHHPYYSHAQQMNYAVSLATYDWVLCIDSDEIPTDHFITKFKQTLCQFDFFKINLAGRIKRNWFVLGRQVHAMYPCSSPDFVVRFFNRQQCRFNDAIVDDKVIGFDFSFIFDGDIEHHTFETSDKMEEKLKIYVKRLNQSSLAKPESTLRGALSAAAAFIKWYIVKKAFMDGIVGIKTSIYAAKYSYMKYTGKVG